MDSNAQTTEILLSVAAGDRSAADDLTAAVYDELRALAQHYMQQERPDHTLQATALANEAYLRLIDQSRVDWKGRAHFFALAAMMIRRILVDHARAHAASKRGGGAHHTSLPGAIASDERALPDLLDLDEALTRLRALNERQSRVVELRYFGGLSVEETAEAIGVSPRTVKGDWAIARAWLKEELSR